MCPRAKRVVLRGVCGLCLLAGLTGCHKPLLAENEERSQFYRYDTIRSRNTQQYVRDEFGYRHPNIRARLEPRQ